MIIQKVEKVRFSNKLYMTACSMMRQQRDTNRGDLEAIKMFEPRIEKRRLE